ncbi:MAG: GNAT family N-acetyltransferase [Methylophilaceae bacterium]|nr:GNAT family N-acetyltransferase [Methylophilaceae bacterium]
MTLATLKYKLYSWNDAKKILMPIRRSVFIIEQLVPEALEWDDWDNKAKHIVLIFNNIPIGCARLIFVDEIVRLERMAIIKSKRNQGFGSKLVYKIIQIAKNKNIKKIIISAQIQALYFYQKNGFIAEGKIYKEAGIKHIKMVLLIK